MAIQFFFFENEVVWLFLGNNHLFKKGSLYNSSSSN